MPPARSCISLLVAMPQMLSMTCLARRCATRSVRTSSSTGSSRPNLLAARSGGCESCSKPTLPHHRPLSTHHGISPAATGSAAPFQPCAAASDNAGRRVPPISHVNGNADEPGPTNQGWQTRLAVRSLAERSRVRRLSTTFVAKVVAKYGRSVDKDTSDRCLTRPQILVVGWADRSLAAASPCVAAAFFVSAMPICQRTGRAREMQSLAIRPSLPGHRPLATDRRSSLKCCVDTILPARPACASTQLV